MTAGVLRIFMYGGRAQLEALAKLCERDEGFDDRALLLEARKRMHKVLEKAYEAGEEVTKEEVVNWVMVLERAHMWMDEYDDCEACFKRAKEGFVRLLGEDHAKSVEATYSIVVQITWGDERIAGLRALLERVKVSLPDEAVSFDIANDLGNGFMEKGKHEETKVFYLTALEGRRSVLRAEHKKTLGSLYNLGLVLHFVEDYEGAQDYCQQGLKVKEKIWGKTHPSTLATMYNMANTYAKVKDYAKAEEMYRLALDGYEKSLGKDHEDTKTCATNLACLYQTSDMNSKPKMTELAQLYPHLMGEPWVVITLTLV